MDDANSGNPDPTHLPGRSDASSRRGELDRMARQHAEATWGDGTARRSIVPGVVSGDVGPKGRISAGLRSLSRDQQASGDHVPRGTTARGGALLVLLPMLAVAATLFAIVGLVIWLVWR